MMPRGSFLCVILALLAPGAESRTTFKINRLEGTVKVQRALKKTWESTYTGDEINDNDMVETFFQTRVTLHYGVDNLIILGSNTRTLFNIKEVEEEGRKIATVNITLFTGGVLIQSVSNSRANIYTSNAVAQIDSGTISTIVEAKTGHTGYQVLGGAAETRNVAQQQGIALNPGQTTIVLPAREPTAPLYMTYRHVAVLKHFFGDEFVDRQIEIAGIKPTEDQATVSRFSLSDGVQSRGARDDLMEKRLFSQDKIWGIILDDRARKRKRYEPVVRPIRPFGVKGEIVLSGGAAFTGGGNYPAIALTPSLFTKNFSIGVTAPLAKNAGGALSLNAGSAAGVLDKIHHLTIGSFETSRYIHFGAIQKYTLGKGLVVDGFENRNIYTVTQPLGLQLRLKNELWDLNGFVSDVSDWRIGGARVGFTPADVILGCGYYYDIDQYKSALNAKTSRFIDVDAMKSGAATLPDRDSVPSHCMIYEVTIGASREARDDFSFDVFFQFAQKLARGGYDGFVVKGPEVNVYVRNIHGGLCYIYERGRLLGGHFNAVYLSNRLRYERIAENTLMYWTQNNSLAREKKSYGGMLYFGIHPIPGMAIDLSFRQDFMTHTPFTRYEPDGSLVPDTVTQKNNFSYALSLKINDKLFAPIRYGELFLRQPHGGIYPRGGTYFASWGFMAGLNAMTAPLLFNVALEGGLYFTYIDLFDERGRFGFLNNNIDSGDNILEFFLGLRWGF